MKPFWRGLGALALISGIARPATAGNITNIKQIANDSGTSIQIRNHENRNDNRDVAAHSIANIGALWISWHREMPLEIKTGTTDFWIYQDGDSLLLSTDRGATWKPWERAHRDLLVLVTCDGSLAVQDAP